MFRQTQTQFVRVVRFSSVTLARLGKSFRFGAFRLVNESRRRIRVALHLPVVLTLILTNTAAQAPIPGKYYDYRVVGMTGQAPTNAPSAMSGMGIYPSINSNGEVAYIGQFSSGGDGIVVVSPTIPAELISFPPEANRTFGNSTEINDVSQVVATDRVSGSPPTYLGRLWDGTKISSDQIYLQSGHFYFTLIDSPLASVQNEGSVNKNNVAVFAALDVAFNVVLVSVQPGLISNTLNELILPAGSHPRPQISDTGQIVVQVGGAANSPIIMYSTDFSKTTAIAKSADFNTLGGSPGISADGRIVAFYGDLNATGASDLNIASVGPGIFASIDDGSGSRQVIRVVGNQVEDLSAAGGNKDGICDPGETCVPAAELGYDSSGNSLYFSSYDPSSRVAVVNLGLTPLAGFVGTSSPVDGNSFVISFVGTPNAQSRPNPTNPAIPLFFSKQLGIWTIRVDVLQQLSGSSPSRVYLPASPIPVAQVGDVIGGNTLASFVVFDQIANAAKDDSGAIRTMRRGDHRVAFWASTSTGKQMIVRASHLDSNQDGLLDSWKTIGIDMNQDGVADLNLGAMGASTSERDLFIELDWMATQPTLSFRPLPGSLTPPLTKPGQPSPFVAMFASAPALTGTAYGLRSDGAAPADIPAGITVHIDAGPGTDGASGSGNPLSTNIPKAFLQGGDEIGLAANPSALVEAIYFGPKGSVSIPGITARSIDDIKDGFFGTTDKRAREFAFHYGVFGMWQFVYNYDVISGACLTTDLSGNYSRFPVPFSSAGTLDPTTGILTSSNSLPSPTCINLASGNYVKILSGSLAGQYFRISAVSGPDLTLKMTTSSGSPTPVTFVLLTSSSGVAELSLQPGPNFNSRPGNDVIITLGSPAWQTGAGVQKMSGDACIQWRTLAHELGHNLGLRHGGTDNVNFKASYLSLMNYTYQLPDPCETSSVQGYSGLDDTVFPDFGNLKHDFPETMIFMGDSLGLDNLGLSSLSPMQPEYTIDDYEALNGPLDVIPPVVSITAPASGSTVSPGGDITVIVKATDKSGVEDVAVAFDINGDGNTTDPGENVPAVLIAPNTYQASFSGITGSTGPRTVYAYANDPAGNVGSAQIDITISSGSSTAAVPNVIGLTQAAATTAISGVGLVVGTITTASSSTVPDGKVISESPSAGTTLPIGAAVNLVISSGPIPTVVSYSVLFGTESYNVVGSTRVHLPWKVVGITAVFSETIATGNFASLSGVTVTSFSGLGTKTLTWLISPVTAANLTTALSGSGPNAIKDAQGNALGGGTGFSHSLKILWGDFNDDGFVSASDLVGINNATLGPYNIFADMNGDGVVNLTDVSVARTRVGTSLP